MHGLMSRMQRMIILSRIWNMPYCVCAGGTVPRYLSLSLRTVLECFFSERNTSTRFERILCVCVRVCCLYVVQTVVDGPSIMIVIDEETSGSNERNTRNNGSVSGSGGDVVVLSKSYDKEKGGHAVEEEKKPSDNDYYKRGSTELATETALTLDRLEAVRIYSTGTDDGMME